MNIISIINMAVAFMLEAIALASCGYFGTMFSQSLFGKVVGAAACVLVMGFLWGWYFAPKGEHRLLMPWLIIGKLILLLIPSYLMYFQKNTAWSVVWAIIVVSHLLVSVIQNEA